VWHSQAAVDAHTPEITLPGTSEQRLLARVLRMAVLILVGVLLVTGASFAPSEHNPARLQGEIEAALQREERTWQNNDAALFNQLLDHQIKREWRRDWFMPWGVEPVQRTGLGVFVISIEPQRDLVLVNTLVTQAATEWWRAIPYREVRFYRQTENGWVRTAPALNDWGKVRTLATPHLRFEFYERDAPAILAIAAPLELAYLKLYALLEREPPAEVVRLTFAVTPDQAHEFSPEDDRLAFASPLLLKTPLGLTPTDYMLHLVVNRLIDHALQETFGGARRRGANRWQSMLRAANGRLRSELLGQRSPWQQQAEMVFRQTSWEHRQLRLTDISDRYSGKIPSRATVMWEYMAAEAVVSYVVQVYGWDGLSDLIRGFGKTSFWYGLIPAAFGSSVEEFEAGWNQYLTEHYFGHWSFDIREHRQLMTNDQ
jgi:hypothetical protein